MYPAGITMKNRDAKGWAPSHRPYRTGGRRVAPAKENQDPDEDLSKLSGKVRLTVGRLRGAGGSGQVDLHEYLRFSLKDALQRSASKVVELFKQWDADGEVDRATLRERAFNFRWATHDHDVMPLTAADMDVPVADAITDALRDYLAPGLLNYGPAEGLPAFLEAAAAQPRRRIGHLGCWYEPHGGWGCVRRPCAAANGFLEWLLCFRVLFEGFGHYAD